MKVFLLVKKGLYKRKGSFFGIALLFFIISISLVTAFTIFINSRQHISLEMRRLGFGDTTVWVHQNEPLDSLSKNLKAMESVADVKTQPLIFAGYSILGEHSDNDGQLLGYRQEEYAYRFLNEDFSNTEAKKEIGEGEIYVSPAMHSTYQFAIGDQIEFAISRFSKPKVFTIKGYFEDPFMGSSMIDMKSFLMNDKEFTALTKEMQGISTFNALARNGAMMHIFQSADSPLSTTEFNQQINQNDTLTQATEFVYSQDAIYNFMMLLQNMLTGFLDVFVIVLLLVSMIVIGYNITHALELERKDMGILKTIGFTSRDLRISQMLQYCFSMISGMLLALFVSALLIHYLALKMVTSSGILITTKIPYGIVLGAFCLILCITILYIVSKTRPIVQVAPIQTILRQPATLSNLQIKMTEIKEQQFIIKLSLRQLFSGKRRYIGTLSIAIVLVFFLSVIGKINAWVGPQGEGVMNAFSVASHDLGVQPMTNINMEEIETKISSHASIEKVYELAMQNVLVEGKDYTANIINDPSYFHIIRGQTSQGDDEIVITEYVANDLNIDIGDSVSISYESQKATYKVVGIYQCANEMGANIGMNVQGYQRMGSTPSYIWCRHYLLSRHDRNETIMKELQQDYPLDIAVHTNSWSGLAGIVSTMHLVTFGMYAIVIVFIFIVMLLTSSKMLYFEQNDMAIFKSIGLTSKQLRISFTLRCTMVVIIGAIIGTLLSMVFADSLLARLLAMFGIGEFQVPLTGSTMLFPIGLTTVLFSIFAYISSYKIKKVTVTQLIKGD